MLYRGDRPMSRGTRVYVGGLVDTKKEELEAEFEKYGKLNSVWVAFNPPGFAFVEFSNRSDAEAACDNLNDSDIFGPKVRVEISRGRGRGGFRGGRGMDRGGREGGDRGGRGRGGFRGRGGGFGGGFDRDGQIRKSFRGGRGGGRGGGRFDDFGGGGRRSDYGDEYDGGRDVSVGRGGFGGRGRSFDSPREFRGRGRGGGRGYSRGGGGDYGGRVSNGDYGSGDYGGPRNTSRFRSRSPVNRGSRQAY